MAETPGVSVNVKVDDDGVSEAFNNLLRLTATLQPVMGEIGGALEGSTQQRFEDEEDPEGKPWPDLAESTRARRGDDARKLRDRGHLVQSITHTASRFETAVGSNKVQARIHQLGGEAGRGLQVEIPARPYLGVSSDDRAAIGGILERHIGELVA
jgi:phage virion morphogenesis protein